MKLRRGRNIRPRPVRCQPLRAEPPTVEQLSEQEANEVGRAAYYASVDCCDGRGSVISWETLSEERREYYIGIAGCVLTEDCRIRGVEIVPRRAQ